jgi:hypothetical protein
MTIANVPNETRTDEQIEILSLKEERAIATIRERVLEMAIPGVLVRFDSIERVLAKIDVITEFVGDSSGPGIFSLNGARFAMRVDIPRGNSLEIRFEPN